MSPREKLRWRDDVQANVCAQKRAFAYSGDAEEVAERHLSCPLCTEGYRMHAYRCPADPSHHHTGHERVSP